MWGKAVDPKFKSVSIPQTLWDEIRELIFKKEWLGYRSVGEFVRMACKNQIASDAIKTSHQDRFKEDDWV
jgi:hypothetical protein